MTILIVEDEPRASRGLKNLINMIGDDFQVVGEALDGKEALDLIRMLNPDVVMTDIRMPVMDGLEAARTIRGMKRADVHDMPLIAMSADAFEEDISKSLSNGINAHLIKPINTARLYATLAEFIPL